MTIKYKNKIMYLDFQYIRQLLIYVVA